MAVNGFPLAGGNFRQFAFGTKKYSGKIHQRSAMPAMRSSAIINFKSSAVRRAPAVFQVGGGHATRQHDEKIHGQVFGGFKNIADAVPDRGHWHIHGINHPTALVPWGTTARTNSGAVSIELST